MGIIDRIRRAPSRLTLYFVLIGIFAFTDRAAADPVAAPAQLDRTTFEARGVNESILTVAKFGRYSIRAKSEQGAQIRLIDRMAGPKATSGDPGRMDGRIDVFLDAGTYKVEATSSTKGKGTLTLSAHPFVELNTPKEPVLVENTIVQGTLSDLQRISYWLEVRTQKTVYLEAQGRDLSDLGLWLEGNWLVAAPVVADVFQGDGRPQSNLRLVANLTPGWYLLTAYGGAARPWAHDTGSHPFLLRYGIRTLDSTVRIREQISPFGVDRYLVPQKADHFFVRLKDKKNLRLEVGDFALGDTSGSNKKSALITKESRDPECHIRHSSEKKFSLVSVTATPGDPYLLQAFKAAGPSPRLTEQSGRFWISTIHAGSLEDNIDACGVLVVRRPGHEHTEVQAADVISVGSGKPWSRRFNLLHREELFFYVEDAGEYDVRGTGVPARFYFTPFKTEDMEKSNEDDTPKAGADEKPWALGKGYWVLQLEPQRKGIVTVEVRKKGNLFDWTPQGSTPIRPVKGNCQIPQVTLEPNCRYTLYLNSQGRVEKGLVMLPLPLTLQQALPVFLQPDQELSIPFTCKENGELLITALPEAAFSSWVDDSSCRGRTQVSKGDHQVRIRNESRMTQEFFVKVTPASVLEGSLPGYLPPQVAETFANFPLLTETNPLFFDFDQGGQKTSVLRVDTPALYRIETTGLLATSCVVRSRTNTNLFSDTSGGSGRNCRVLQYLKPGEYQVSVQTLGQSKGHAGLTVSMSAVIDGGSLVPGREMRENVKAGSAVQYTLSVARPAEYRFRTLGTGKSFKCRLEGRDGWPLATNTDADIFSTLSAGVYRYMSLPRDVDTLRISQVDEVVPNRQVAGRGPHVLALNETLENVWREPAGGLGLSRDLYDVTIPATVDATITLGSEQMQAHLFQQIGQQDSPAGIVPPKKGWSGKLGPGHYRLEVECSRPNDKVPYSVCLSVQQLVAGLSREIELPESLSVSVCQGGVVELFSHGTLDVRAKLFRDSDGELVDACDDAENDWNFRISRWLAPGAYTLKVQPVGAHKGTTRVSMNVPEESARTPLTLPFDAPVELGGKINIFPLVSPVTPGLLTIRATGESLLACAFERVSDEGALILAQRTGRTCEIELPTIAEGRYQLRLWSADHLYESAHLSVSFVVPESVSLDDLGSPRSLEGRHVARVAIDRPGLFRVRPIEGFSCSDRPDHPLDEHASDLIHIEAGTTTMKWTSSGSNSTPVQMERVTLRPGLRNAIRMVVPPGASREFDVAPGREALALLIAETKHSSFGCALAQASGKSPVHSTGYERFEGGCVAVALPGASRAVIWDTRPSGTEDSPVTVRLESMRPSELEGTLSAGRTHGRLAEGGQAHFALPAGPKLLEVDLERGLVAFTWDKDNADNVACASTQSKRSCFETVSSHLVIFDLSGKGGQYRVGLLGSKTVQPAPVLGYGGLYERVLAAPATIRLDLDPSLTQQTSAALFVAGNDVTCEYTDDRGVAHQGNAFRLGGHPGHAVLTARQGVVKAWVAEDRNRLEARWGIAKSSHSLSAEPNTVIPLSGKDRTFSVVADSPRVIHFKTDHPAAAYLASADGPFLDVVEGTNGCELTHYVTPGRYTIGVRGLERADLVGQASVEFADVTPLHEGAGPEELIGGGEVRTFSFTVTRKGPIGIGVRSEREALQCELLTCEERSVGKGIQQFVVLTPGTYLLRIRAASGLEPVRFAPVVVGLEPPGLGPPEDYVRKFFAREDISQGENAAVDPVVGDLGRAPVGNTKGRAPFGNTKKASSGPTLDYSLYEFEMYKIKSGDTLEKIATTFYPAGGGADLIAKYNRLSGDDPPLKVGERILIPVPRVEKGIPVNLGVKGKVN